MSSLLDQLNAESAATDAHFQQMRNRSNQAIQGYDHSILQEKAMDQGYKQAKGLAMQLGSQAAGHDIQQSVEQFAFAAPGVAKTGKYLYKKGLSGARAEISEGAEALKGRIADRYSQLRGQASEMGERAQEGLHRLQGRAAELPARVAPQQPFPPDVVSARAVGAPPPEGALRMPGGSILADVHTTQRPQVSEEGSAVGEGAQEQPLGRFAEGGPGQARFADPVGEGGFMSLKRVDTGEPVSFEQKFPSPPKTFKTGTYAGEADMGVKEGQQIAPFRGAAAPTQEEKESLLYERIPEPKSRTPAEGRLPKSSLKAAEDPDLREASLPKTAIDQTAPPLAVEHPPIEYETLPAAPAAPRPAPPELPATAVSREADPNLFAPPRSLQQRVDTMPRDQTGFDHEPTEGAAHGPTTEPEIPTEPTPAIPKPAVGTGVDPSIPPGAGTKPAESVLADVTRQPKLGPEPDVLPAAAPKVAPVAPKPVTTLGKLATTEEGLAPVEEAEAELPGIGEGLMALTAIGGGIYSLFEAHHDEHPQVAPAPQQPKILPPQPQGFSGIAFDAAPIIDSSQFHQI